MQQNVQVLGSALLCVHRVFLFLGGFLGGLTDPVEMALGFLNAGPGLTRELSWVPKLEFGKHFMDLLSTRFPPGRSCNHCTFAIDEATQTTLRDGGHVLGNGLMKQIQLWLPSAFRWLRLGQVCECLNGPIECLT